LEKQLLDVSRVAVNADDWLNLQRRLDILISPTSCTLAACSDVCKVFICSKNNTQLELL